MINFSRGSGDRPPEPQDVRTPPKPALRPAVYESPSQQSTRSLPPDPSSLRDGGATPPRAEARADSRVDSRGESRSESRVDARAESRLDSHVAERQGTPSVAASAPQHSPSKLFVGVNIKLKGVEISDCDLLVIEGHVEATVHSKEMEISAPGTLNGTALIDVAEVHGEFAGELTARTRLVVHGTGKVSGTIRYGKLVVAEGGTISGDMKQIDAVETKPAPSPSRPPVHEGRHSNSSSRNAGAS